MGEILVRVLLIEDDEDDYVLVRKLLSSAKSVKYDLQWAPTYERALEAMGRDRHDVYLLDYYLGERNGLELLSEMNGRGSTAPVIFLTGHADYGVDMEAMRAGASDYLVKGRINAELLERSIRYALERKRLEEQLRQAQKMEAIGTLAGGIAHDFNNILAAIIGFTQMVLDDAADNAQVQHKMERVLQAGLRGRDLVRQILAFSRKTEGEQKEISLTPLVKETHALLRSSLPTTIQMNLSMTTSDDHVLADPTQLQQVLMNLVTNAAYAMRDNGGLLTIGLSSVTFLQGSLLPDPEMEPGTYVQLTVQDTGTGMTDEVRQRIFEPFFTTKEPGQGTGMGLAVVYGIVKAHRGALTVQSEVGQGSTLDVFLPQAQKSEATKEETAISALPTGAERILFVDDEEMLVEMVRGILESLGYNVTVAANGSEAWNLFLEDPSRFDLVITDQTMPDVTGVTLAQKMLRVRTDIPIILCTGYSEMVSAEKAKEVGICEFVMKPTVKKEFAETIRRVLDGRTH